MRKQRAYLQVFCLLLFAAEPAFSLLGVPPFSLPAQQPQLVDRSSDTDCYPGYPEISQANLTTCCWYNSFTCCTPEIAPTIIPWIVGNLTVWSSLGLQPQCYNAIADLLCLACAPNTKNFISDKGGSTSTYQISICTSFCDSMLAACQQDLDKMSFITYPPYTGTEFCIDLFQGDSRMTVSDFNCFGGVSFSEIQTSGCLPSKPTIVPTSGGYSSGSSTTSTYPTDQDDLLRSVVAITGTLLVLVGVLLVCAVVAGIALLWQRLGSLKWYSWKAEEYPDDIPLEEIAPATSSDSSPPVTLHRSSSGGIPVRIKVRNSQGEKEV